jgi:REP element-mobilizing transposase RayT
MPVRPDFDPANAYFITTTAVQRAHLFQRDAIKHIIADSLAYMKANHWLHLHAFVLMPNHVHLVVRFLGDHTLSNVMRDFKSYTAHYIIRQLEADGNDKALSFLEQAASRVSRQKYKVWEEGYDARDVFSPDFLRQKAEYIHNNPCQPHWGLAEHPEDYPWSSARFYLLGKPAIIPVDDIGGWLV